MYRDPFVYQSAASRVGLKQRGYSWTMAISFPSILSVSIRGIGPRVERVLIL